MDPTLRPEARQALETELARLESEMAQALREYQERIDGIRRLLSSPNDSKATRKTPRVKGPLAGIGFRAALREVLHKFGRPVEPVLVAEEMIRGGVDIPGGAKSIKSRVYVELGKLYNADKLTKTTDKTGTVFYGLPKAEAKEEPA